MEDAHGITPKQSTRFVTQRKTPSPSVVLQEPTPKGKQFSTSSQNANKKSPRMLSPAYDNPKTPILLPSSPLSQSQLMNKSAVNTEIKKREDERPKARPTKSPSPAAVSHQDSSLRRSPRLRAQNDQKRKTNENVNTTPSAVKSPSTASPFRKISRVKSPREPLLVEPKDFGDIDMDSSLPFCDEPKPRPLLSSREERKSLIPNMRRRSSLVRGRRSMLSESSPLDDTRMIPEEEAEMPPPMRLPIKGKGKTQVDERLEQERRKEKERQDRKKERKQEKAELKEVTKQLASYRQYMTILEKEEQAWTSLWGNWGEKKNKLFRERAEPLPGSSYVPSLSENQFMESAPDYSALALKLSNSVMDKDFAMFDRRSEVRRKQETLANISCQIEKETEIFVENELRGLGNPYDLIFQLGKLTTFEPSS